MIVLVTTAASASLRGELTRWLIEISPGVFVGTVSARVREEIWRLTCDNIGSGRATLIYPQRNEQRLAIMTAGSTWEAIDFDGLTLIRRPNEQSIHDSEFKPGFVKAKEVAGWSIAGRRRYYKNSIERRHRN